MKFSKLSQLFLVSSIGLLVATLLTACQLVTIDYVFVADGASASSSSTNGSIETYAVDSQSGALRTAAAAVDAGGANPVALAVTPDYANLYVANKDNDTVIHFAIAANGILTEKDSVTTTFVPASLAVNPAGTFLYVVGGTNPSEVAEYPLSSGTIGTLSTLVPLSVPGYTGDLLVPTGVTVLADDNGVYVTAYDESAYNPGGTTTSTANPGWIFGFVPDATSGALTPTTGSPYKAGVKPTALAADPTSRFVYVTDFASNELIGYGVETGGILNFMVDGPFKTGSEPMSVAVDPRGKYIYVANSLDSTVSAYVISLLYGTPSAAINPEGTATNATDTQPVALAVDPALGRFVYTANYLGNSLSGFQLDPNAGTVKQTQATPYPTGERPTALVIVPHGNHSTQATAP